MHNARDSSMHRAAAALAASMWLIWNELVDRTPRAPVMIVAATAILTPLALKTISIGQTSPLLLLSVCLGIGARNRRRQLAAILVWVVSVAFKTSPALLIGVLGWRRRFRELATAITALHGPHTRCPNMQQQSPTTIPSHRSPRGSKGRLSPSTTRPWCSWRV